VWPSGNDEVSGKRVTLIAEDADSAQAALVAEYGEDAVFTLWNKEDAARPRGSGS
jgi:hypothetical protein